MRTVIALVIAIAACGTDHKLPGPPPTYPSPSPPLVEYSYVDACSTIAEVSCFDACSASCFDSVYIACCNGQDCANYGDAFVYAPSKSDSDTQWNRCIHSSPKCGAITSACELMAPGFAQ